jgi:Macrocin-O-methyltransferase (TylF)
MSLLTKFQRFRAKRYHQILPHQMDGAEAAARFMPVRNVYIHAQADQGDPIHMDTIRVVHLFNLIKAANDLPAGDFIELGTFRGFLLRVIHKFMNPAQTLYALDTFEGFDQRDIDAESQLRYHNWKAGSFLPTSAEGVARYVGDGEPPANLKIIKGWFPDSYAGLEGLKWRFVHIDFDLYQPIKLALTMLWDQVVPGGVVMIHDYGCVEFPGARRAVDEFCSRTGIFPVELGDRWGTAVIRKPVTDTLTSAR